ncbi:uncharacterized protein KY384_001413 [Bacidia gigantensis]|uniref:uncharacterized protein n=1 Tax=Bacidia gigantensis TaxID=2732470 RepID=UPI001D037C66|nr:uncharacterized protein KY384_001413 [Bacidia gigantensis]KAG8533672.1 hypothetical protein KY384_001413 [Bacidia gigantensis]
MSNISSHGSPGPPTAPHANPGPPRRTSYASVAAGVAAIGQQSPSVHLPTTPFAATYPQSYSDHLHLPHSTDADSQLEGSTRIPESWGSGARESTSTFNSTNFSKQAYNPWGIFPGSTGVNGFFKPTYLRGSKYMEELEAIYDASMEKAEEEDPVPARSGHSSLSKSSSSVSLPKMQASHRGMSYEIIEHQPQPMELGPGPLPSKWQEVDKHNSIEIASDGQQVRFVGPSKLSDHEAAATRTDHPMPSSAGIYYYEVYIESKGKDGLIGVGFSGGKVSLERLPGWEPDSWAYHGDDGKTFCCQQIPKPFGPTFSSTDTIGCGVNFVDGTAFFTKNGILLDTEIIQQRKRQILEEIDSVDISPLHPKLDGDNLAKALIAQYLSHDGYVETAQTFAEEVRREAAALQASPETPVDKYLAVEEDRDAANRQQIRAAVLDGDIDTTIRLTNTYFPTVFLTHRDVNFRVRCRKYIEMMRQSAELWDTSPSPTTYNRTDNSEINGSDRNGTDVADQDMDMDGLETEDGNSGPKNEREDGTANDAADGVDDHMDLTSEPVLTTRSPNPVGYDEMLSKTINYGQDLNNEFKDEQDPKFREHVNETLKELFSMLAYKDPRTSPARKLLEPSERVKVAEGLNSAILGVFRYESRASMLELATNSPRAFANTLERMYKQTVVLTDMISEDGGPGSLVNVRHLLKSGETSSHLR